MPELDVIIALLLLGSIVGFTAGLLGIGGGAMLVPSLTAIFLHQGVPLDNLIHLALGTSMASIIFTSISSLRAHHARECVEWPIVRQMIIGILIGSFSATFIATLMSSLFLAIFFSAFMAYASLHMFLGQKAIQPMASSREFFIVGTGIGALSSLVSIGGASLTVPYLVRCQIDIKKAIGTSAAIGLPISLAGTLGYTINGLWHTSNDNFTFGFVYWPGAILISMAGSIFAPIGVSIAHRLPVQRLKKIFGVFLILLSIKMLISVIQGH